MSNQLVYFRGTLLSTLNVNLKRLFLSTRYTVFHEHHRYDAGCPYLEAYSTILLAQPPYISSMGGRVATSPPSTTWKTQPMVISHPPSTSLQDSVHVNVLWSHTAKGPGIGERILYAIVIELASNRVHSSPHLSVGPIKTWRVAPTPSPLTSPMLAGLLAGVIHF